MAKEIEASMKGGRTAPRNLSSSIRYSSFIRRFNEGGADCPPKHGGAGEWRADEYGFNEGGADCPPKPAGLA